MGNEITSFTASDRSPVIIALGIAAIIILGPITGIPAWIMANQDLRDLHAGYLPPSASNSLTLGRILAIIGTFFSPLWLVVFATVIFVLIMVVGEVAMTMF
jgi:hypothetical protein